MGQTLTHGVYLPDEGERNCYSGLAANWQLLDGAVGTIAEHTSALAGKAPLVHTHTKSDITDFPAYGNAAGTICEGNDSRLSDARTPVAHTHTKSDVTDLFNSDFIPSANNSYDVGSSSYQWNNLYAKNYYYNGTAWGLDKQNEWTNFQRMICNPAVWYLRNNAVTLGTTPASNRYLGTFFEDVNGDSLGHVSFQANKSGVNSIQFNIANSDGTNTYAAQMRLRLAQDGASAFIPEVDNTIKFGDSGNHWKDCYTYLINGTNPGALSLPNLDSDGYIDLSDNISANSEYLYTPVYDGWLALYCQTTGFHAENAVGIFNREDAASYRWANTVTSSINLLRFGNYHGSVILPVRAGIRYGCWVVVNSSTSLATATLFFYKAKGNV